MDRVRTPIRPDASSDAIWTPAAAARLLGIAPSTLRCWHRRYRLGTAGVDPGRHRRYTAAELDSLTRMKQLIADGLSPASAAVQAFRPVPGAPAGPRAIVDAALRLDADALVGLLGAQFAAQGTEWTWDRLCRPALTSLCAPRPTVTHERVDVMHLLSGAIITALHRLPVAPLSATPAVLMACVEGERHTLPLEVLRAALAQRGTPVRFLGADLPAGALVDALARTDQAPAAVVLWAQAPAPVPGGVLRESARRGTRVVLGGPGWDTDCPHRNVVRTATLQDALGTVAGR